MKKIFLFLLILVFVFGCSTVKVKSDKDLDQLLKEAEQTEIKWSDYDDMGAGVLDDLDTFLVRDVSDTGLAATGTQKELPYSVLKTDLILFFYSDKSAPCFFPMGICQ